MTTGKEAGAGQELFCCAMEMSLVASHFLLFCLLLLRQGFSYSRLVLNSCPELLILLPLPPESQDYDMYLPGLLYACWEIILPMELQP